MYAIYTTIYGILVPNELNEDLQEAEFTELFYDITKVTEPKGFCCSVPYSGDGLADIHLGVAMDSTESNSKKVISEPTAEQKECAEIHIPIVKEMFLKIIKEMREEHPDWEQPGDAEIIDKFLALLDISNLEVYRAYSTS